MRRAEGKSGKGNGRFIGIPHRVAASPQWCGLSAHEVKLLIDLAFQYTGFNNGNLTAAHSIVGERGWVKSTLYRTLDSLKNKGFVVVTRQGWKQRGKPTLLALTWQGIDEPPRGIEYDAGIKADPVPLNYWYKPPEYWKKKPP